MCSSSFFDFGGICVTFVTFFPINLSGSTFLQLFSNDGSFVEVMAPLLMPPISSAYSPLKEVTMDADWNFLLFKHKNHPSWRCLRPAFLSSNALCTLPNAPFGVQRRASSPSLHAFITHENCAAPNHIVPWKKKLGIMTEATCYRQTSHRRGQIKKNNN